MKKNNSTNEFSTGCLAILGAIALIPILIATSALLNGWVLTKLWGWFIVPAFELPSLTLLPAIGIGLVVSLLTHQHVHNDYGDDKAKALASALGAMILSPLMSLAIGYIVTLFM